MLTNHYDYEKAIEYHEEPLKIAKEVGDRAGEGVAYGNIGNTYQLLGDYQKDIEYHEEELKISKEVGDRVGGGIANHNIGNGYFSLEQLEKAVENSVCAVEALNAVRSCLQSKDD